MHDHEAIRSAVAPVLAELKLSLYDVEFSGTGRARVVRVTVESPLPADLEAFLAGL